MATAVATDRERLAPAEPSQFVQVWRRFRKHKLGVIGLVMIFVIVLTCVVIPMVSPYSSTTPGLFWLPMSGDHWLGTDRVGRDEFTRLFEGGRISLLVGMLTTVTVIVLGSLVGSISGFYGGWVDQALMRFVDLMLSIPTLPILLIMSKMMSESKFMENIFGRDLGTVMTIITVLSLFGWMGIARLVRGSILALRSQDFVEATRALGASNRRIIFRHLIPNSMAPLIVASTLYVGDFIISETALSYLGLGISAPTPSWGNMLNDARNEAFIADPTYLNPFGRIESYLIIFPGIMILLTVLSINFMGDALRDALDPRLKT